MKSIGIEIASAFPNGFVVKAYCPICHRPLHSIGRDYETGGSTIGVAGTCNEHGKQTPTKLIYQPKGRDLPRQEFAAAGTSEKV